MYILVLYCCLIAMASAAGGTLPSRIRMTHARIQSILSLVCGVMLGVALMHLFPHSVQLLGGNSQTSGLLVLGGLLFMLFLIRMFNFHHHDFQQDHIHSAGCDHDHHHDHQAIVQIGHAVGDESVPAHVPKDIGWAGLCFGLAIHTLMDGIALAAAFSADRGGHWLPGVGTFLAVALHKPLDAISITALMAARNFSVSQQMAVNVIFAMMAPMGAIVFALTVEEMGVWRDTIIGGALAISAGFFLCISLGDLLPEVHFHSHDRGWLSLMLLAGVAVAFVLEFVIGHGPMAMHP